MSSKQFKNIRIYPEDKIKMTSLLRELNYNENKRVSYAELVRRTLRIPRVDEIIKFDSKINKRQR